MEKKSKKVLLGVIVGVIVLAGIVIAAINVNNRIQEENAAIKAKKERIAKEEAAAAAQKQLVQEFHNIYSSLDGFNRSILKSSNGYDINFQDAAFLNETDYVVIGDSARFEEDPTKDTPTKSFIKRFTKGNDKALWTKEIVGYFHSVAVTGAGDILVTGDNGYESKTFTVKYSSLGEQLWKKNITVEIIDDEDNYVTVTNNTITKLDSNGTILWKKSLDNKMLSSFCIQDTKQNYIVIGESSTGKGKTSKGIIIQYNKDGEKLLTKEFNGIDLDYLTDVQPLSNGGFVVVGSVDNTTYTNGYERKNGTSNDCFIIKYDSDGNIISKIKYGNPNLDETFNDIEVVNINGRDDIIIAVGTSYDQFALDGEVLINDSDKALMVVFEGDKVLYEHIVTDYKTSNFNRIALYNNDWRTPLLIGSVFDDSNRKGGIPLELFKGGYQGFLMFK